MNERVYEHCINKWPLDTDLCYMCVVINMIDPVTKYKCSKKIKIVAIYVDLSQLHNCSIHFRLETEKHMKRIFIRKVANAPTYLNSDRLFFSKRN